MICIGNPYIKRNENKSRVCSDITIDDINYEMYFEVDSEYEEFLCFERADAFLVGLLPYAMNHSHTIESEGVISEKLYYQITSILIPSLSKYISNNKFIKIYTNLDCNVLPNQNAVGTGLSAGVDSFHTIFSNLNKETVNYNITHLTFFNVGSHGSNGGGRARELYQNRMKKVKEFADEYNFEFIAVDSNISELLNMSFVKTHTFRSFSAALSLQKLFSKYYYSSGFPLDEFAFSEKSTAYYDLLNVHTLSTENISFYSTGATESRLEKVDYITTYKPTYKYLNVCFRNGTNCGRCEKCIRTMLELYALNKLDFYSSVFDIAEFNKSIHSRMGFMLANKNNTNYKEIIHKLRQNKKPITLRAYIYCIGFTIFNKVKNALRTNTFLKSIYYKFK